MFKTCQDCGAQAYRAESKFCAKCGSSNMSESKPHINICMNPECPQHKGQFIYPNESGFCDICGSKTAFNS